MCTYYTGLGVDNYSKTENNIPTRGASSGAARVPRSGRWGGPRGGWGLNPLCNYVLQVANAGK